MPWLQWLLFSLPAVTAVSSPRIPWRRRDAVAGAAGAAGAAAAGAWVPWADAKADVQWAEEVLSAGGNADSPWNKPRMGYAWLNLEHLESVKIWGTTSEAFDARVEVLQIFLFKGILCRP